MRRFLLLSLLAVAPACGDDPCAGRRDLLQSPKGLVLTLDEHVLGWGQAECFQCHQTWNLHSSGCSEVLGDSAGDIDAWVDPQDTRSCIPCHGDNGVSEWGQEGSP